jgi:hypothetical protein
MRLSLDGARERMVGPNYAMVQCVSAMWMYRYLNGYTVIHRGPFTAHIIVMPNGPPFMLKIDHIQFDCNLYEKLISMDQIGGSRLDAKKTPQVRIAPTPSPTVNDVGVPPQLPSQLPQLPSSQAGQRDDERQEGPGITYERAFIPAEPVNAFGIPQITMRHLEVRPPNTGSSPKNPHGLLVGGAHWRDVRSHGVFA